MPYIYLPDNTPSRNYGGNTQSSTFGGSFSNAGSDPRERGRTRSRREIEASSRAEHLAKQEHLAKLRAMKTKRDEEEAGKKTSAARTKVLARDDVQGAMQSQAAHQAAQAAAKNKPLERLTPEQSLAKGQAEKRQRDAVERERVKALPSTAMSELMAERKPEDSGLMAALNKQNTINDWLGTSGPDLRPEQYPAQYDRDAEPAAPASSPAAAMPQLTAQPNTGKNQNRMNAFEGDSPEVRRKVEEELMNPSGRARPVAKPAQPVQGLLAQSAAEQNMDPKDREFVQGQRRAYQGAALPYTFPTGLANYYGGEGGRKLMSDTLGAFEGAPEAISNMFGEYKPGPGGQKMLDNAADYLEQKVSPTIDAGVQYAKDRIAEVGPGAQRMADRAAEYLEPRVSPAIDAATRYGQQKFSDAMTAVNRPLAEGGLRFDPGVRMPPQREVGGATGGSIGAPTAPREGLNPTSMESLLNSILPPAYPDAMSAEQASMKANDAWREEMARAEAEASTFGPPAPEPKGKVKVKRRR
jgi:hypothetical protein